MRGGVKGREEAHHEPMLKVVWGAGWLEWFLVYLQKPLTEGRWYPPLIWLLGQQLSAFRLDALKIIITKVIWYSTQNTYMNHTLRKSHCLTDVITLC